MKRYSDFDKRMKKYEKASQSVLMNRVPVAVRLDGKAFHTFTRGFNKPFDELLVRTMQETMRYLCKNIQGCVLGYTQSDEITLILIDYQKEESCAWYDYRVQKLCSVTASMATMIFNKEFDAGLDSIIERQIMSMSSPSEEELSLMGRYTDAINSGAMFDSRCFNIPKEEVTNLIYWRQQDATTNSIQMVGQANFTQKELMNKSCNDIQDMLFTQKDVNWNDYPVFLKRGSCCIKTEEGWIIDNNIPIFKDEGREYIEKLIL